MSQRLPPYHVPRYPFSSVQVFLEYFSLGYTGSVDFDKFAQQLGQDADSLVMEITVKEDKSFSINMMGQKKEGTWEEKSGKYTLTLDGTDQEAEIKDGKLTLIDESVGTSMTFEKK